MDIVPANLATGNATVNSVGCAFPSAAQQHQETSSPPSPSPQPLAPSPSPSPPQSQPRSPRGHVQYQREQQEGPPLVASLLAASLLAASGPGPASGSGFAAAIAQADSAPVVAGEVLTAAAPGSVVIVVGRDGEGGFGGKGEMDVDGDEVMVDAGSDEGSDEGGLEEELDEEMEEEETEDDEMEGGQTEEDEPEEDETEEDEPKEEETEEEETEEETEEEDDDKAEDKAEEMEEEEDEYEQTVRRRLVDPDYDPYDPTGAPPNATWFGEDRFEEPLFHRVVHAIEYYGMGRKPPFVRCAIYTDAQLSIRGLPLYEAREAEDRATLPGIARGVVLICGHMLCKPCWTLNEAHHLSNSDEEGNPPRPLRCPICRTVLHHPVCGCRIPALTMPMNVEDPAASERYVLWWGRYYDYARDNWAADFPRTLNDGGSVPGMCEKCARG
ncbi:hypothetical protein C8A01DRAFT_34249 [Parachaetomium inaequale]|uniref:RING-type domain-containing protein n=1 Tax=Parachaetomium inaequale TaxID=2588326 RepID=A0AAN6PJF0_9PEZI|nr:hypothetical protein C8A01DRAFT_34249 [Parachaetomium inaequale]